MANGIKLETVAPALFVLLWSTGWIVAKYANDYAGPLTFLTWRFAIAALAFAIIAVIMSAKWPTTRAGWLHAFISGLFLHAIYLGGVWWAIKQGVPASISGLLAALQPLMTAMIAFWIIKERLTVRQRMGIAVGLIGLLIAIGPRLLSLDTDALLTASLPLIINVIAMASVTFGTIYQKRFLQEGDLIPVATLQYVGAFIFIAPAAMILEPSLVFDLNIHSILAMIWSVFGLSLGAILLLLYLIRRGQVSRAASLIYLVPPAVGIEAWILFGETPTIPFIIGTFIVVAGVWLVNHKRPVQKST
ncbi:DMT family transporter [Ahrensia sp. 13_GOM-1096m]|uniref:DMT family transporter n=1 Tax=Ahrensia sp. 13_GOM-1096m TaxID=1380380 RepID=UPI000A4A947D|nr:DMT family transporter [Ahrensia sp. 13_GOM-1096m]